MTDREHQEMLGKRLICAAASHQFHLSARLKIPSHPRLTPDKANRGVSEVPFVNQRFEERLRFVAGKAEQPGGLVRADA